MTETKIRPANTRPPPLPWGNPRDGMFLGNFNEPKQGTSISYYGRGTFFTPLIHSLTKGE